MNDTLLPSRARRILGPAVLVLAAALATAHDEDWRKLADKIGAVEGEIWRLGDPVPRDGSFAASGVTCLAQFPLNAFNAGSIAGNDCWGYVSPSGREYAIMGLYNGFGFVEITDPVNSQIIEFIPGPGSDWHDVKVIGTYAYGVSEGGSGVQVMDLSDVDNGNVTLVRNSQLGGHSTTHNIIADTASGTLWLCGANIGNGGLVHLDLSDPTRPTPSGGWTQMYVHDAHVLTPTSGPYAGRQIAFCASGFDGGFTSTGLRIVDVTNPAAPVVLSTLFYPNAGYSHQIWVDDNLQYAYLNDELDEDFGLVPTTTTRIIDVSDFTAPAFAGTFTSGVGSIDHNLYIDGPYVFEANYRSGLRVFDATVPTAPVQIAWFDTFPGSDASSFNGAWSCYPFFPSGTVIVSDIERGLFVLRVDAIDTQRLDLDLASAAPDIISPNGGGTIDLAVTEINLDVDPATVALVFDDGSGPVQIPGSPLGGDLYRFTFPIADCGEASYYFTASDTLGEQFFLPSNAPASTFSAVVADSQNFAFDDNFETNLGWTVTGNAASAATGRWERAIPAGDGSRGDPADDGDGSGRCYVTGNGGAGSNTDVDSGNTILTSPAFDLSAMPEARIAYLRWYDNTGSGSGSNAGVETFEVQISNNNGSTWAPLETVGPTGEGSSGGWIPAEFRVADFLTPTSTVRLRFIASDDVGAVVEAGVDQVRAFDYLCDPEPPCVADLDGNGSLNLDDVTAFAGAFVANQPLADLDSNGAWNLDDVTIFIAAFVAGCP